MRAYVYFEWHFVVFCTSPMPQKMNNEQIGISSISSSSTSASTSIFASTTTTTASSSSSSSSAASVGNKDNKDIISCSSSSNSAATAQLLIKAISTGATGGHSQSESEEGGSNNTDNDADIATLVTKIQAIIPDTPIVSIAAGTLSESTTTTTSTKTTPTPYFKEQPISLMSHNVKLEQQQPTASNNDSQSSETTNSSNNNDVATADPSQNQNHVAACDKKSADDAAAAAAAASDDAAAAVGSSNSLSSAHHNLKLTPLLSKSGQPAPEVIAAATALHQRRGATTKGKTQDDQNVGKRLKKKKVKEKRNMRLIKNAYPPPLLPLPYNHQFPTGNIPHLPPSPSNMQKTYRSYCGNGLRAS